jgi:hypothetical protein
LTPRERCISSKQVFTPVIYENQVMTSVDIHCGLLLLSV